MDTRDPALRQEVERRLQLVEVDEAADAAHAPLARADLGLLGLIVAVCTVVGLLLVG